MTQDSDKKEQSDEDLGITDKAFKELYLPELADYPGLEKGGACMVNAHRVAEYLISQGVPRDRLQFLYIAAPTPMGPDIIHPNVSTLREEEQEKSGKKVKGIEWAYHAAVMTKDTKQVFDLSSRKDIWGAKIDIYMKELFVNARGLSDYNLRFVVTTLDSLDEMINSNAGIDVSELTRRGEKNDGGMSSIWMLENKPEDEWYWKNN